MGLWDTISGIGKGVSDFFGSGLGKAATQVGGSITEGFLGREAAEDARSFTEKQMKNRHQWEVQDLLKALAWFLRHYGNNQVVRLLYLQVTLHRAPTACLAEWSYAYERHTLLTQQTTERLQLSQ